MFPNLSIPKPRPPNVRVPLVRVIQWGFLPSKYPFPYFDVSSSFLSINMCLPQRKHLNPHLPKAELPLCHSQAFSQRGATACQLLLRVPLWTRVLRVLTQQNEEMAPPWVTCAVSELPNCVSTSQVMQGVFLRRDCRGSTGLARRKNLWNMVWLWLLLNDVRSSEYSMPIFSYLTSSGTSSLLPWFYYTSSFGVTCCNLPLVFLSAEFWREGGHVSFSLQEASWMELHFVSQSVSITTERERKLLLWYTSHTHIYNKQHMQAGWRNF